jgi:hypothetical protein
MKFQERLTRWFESMFLALAMAWTIGIAFALLHPQLPTERHGVVEIYSLVAVNDSQAAL